jgi:hypothetical protein
MLRETWALKLSQEMAFERKIKVQKHGEITARKLSKENGT